MYVHNHVWSKVVDASNFLGIFNLISGLLYRLYLSLNISVCIIVKLYTTEIQKRKSSYKKYNDLKLYYFNYEITYS